MIIIADDDENDVDDDDVDNYNDDDVDNYNDDDVDNDTDDVVDDADLLPRASAAKNWRLSLPGSLSIAVTVSGCRCHRLCVTSGPSSLRPVASP